MELPLHFRYQPPSSSSSHSPYKTVTIPPPMVFISASQLPTELQHNSIRLPCNASSSNPNSLCSWTRTQLYGKKSADDELKLMAEIPQGLEEHQTMVVGLTVLTTLMATMFIAYKIVKVKCNGKKNQ